MSGRVAKVIGTAAALSLALMFAFATPVDSELQPTCPTYRPPADAPHARSVPRRQEPEPREVARWLVS